MVHTSFFKALFIPKITSTFFNTLINDGVGNMAASTKYLMVIEPWMKISVSLNLPMTLLCMVS